MVPLPCLGSLTSPPLNPAGSQLKRKPAGENTITPQNPLLAPTKMTCLPGFLAAGGAGAISVARPSMMGAPHPQRTSEDHLLDPQPRSEPSNPGQDPQLADACKARGLNSTAIKICS